MTICALSAVYIQFSGSRQQQTQASEGLTEAGWYIYKNNEKWKVKLEIKTHC